MCSSQRHRETSRSRNDPGTVSRVRPPMQFDERGDTVGCMLLGPGAFRVDHGGCYTSEGLLPLPKAYRKNRGQAGLHGAKAV
jgi:hypothetical protein